MSLLVDTHIHLDAPELQGKGYVLSSLNSDEIGAFIVPGVRVAGWPELLEQTIQHPSVYAAPGVHPAYAEQWTDTAAQQLVELCRAEQVVAIGEVGLDGVSGPGMKRQEQVLREQLAIALNAGLPVLLHGRKATGRLLDILRELKIGQQIGGVWHGFSGSLPVAEELVMLGFKIGVGPILLRESARKLPLAVGELPLESLVLETDLPDMAATPEELCRVAAKVAELRNLTLDDVAEATTRNACQLFKIKV